MDEPGDRMFLHSLAQKGEGEDPIRYLEGENVALEEKKTVAAEEEAAATPSTKHAEEGTR